MRSQSTAWTFADKGNNTVGKPIASGIVSLLDGVVDPDSNARFSNIEIAILFLHRAEEFTELFTSSKEFGAKIGTMKQQTSHSLSLNFFNSSQILIPPPYSK